MASKLIEAAMKLRRARTTMEWVRNSYTPKPLERERFLWETIDALVDATDLLSRALAEKMEGETDAQAAT